MRILILNQYFYPDVAATAQMVSDLAIDLAAAGAEVTAVTSQAAYVGQDRYPRTGNVGGVRILRVPSTNYGRTSVAGRMADYLTFYMSCAAQIATLPHQDICITLSTPPLVSLLGALAKIGSLARTKFVYWVQDVYPDVAIQFGLLSRRSPAAFGFEALSRASLFTADAIVALEQEMANRLIDKGAARDKIHVIPNWSDGTQVGHVSREHNWFLDRHELRDSWVVLYSGNMGRGHEFDTLLGAAERLVTRKDILFLFIGDGAKRREIEAFATTHSNVRLLPYQRREDLPFSLASADLCAITLSDGLEGLVVPSKLYGALAARRAVLFIGPPASEPAIVVRRERCGGEFRHGDVAGVSNFIEALAQDRSSAIAMGERGRTAFEHQFARNLSTSRFVNVCESLLR